MRALLSAVGVIFIIAWLVLWLAVKITFGAIHLLLAVGIILLIIALVRAATPGPGT
jgi:hypothetical protein